MKLKGWGSLSFAQSLCFSSGGWEGGIPIFCLTPQCSGSGWGLFPCPVSAQGSLEAPPGA